MNAARRRERGAEPSVRQHPRCQGQDRRRFLRRAHGVLRSVGTVIGGLNAIDATAANGSAGSAFGCVARRSTWSEVQHVASSFGKRDPWRRSFVTSGLAAGAARAGTKIYTVAPVVATSWRGPMALSRPRRKMFRRRSGRARKRASLALGPSGELLPLGGETFAPVLSSASARAHGACAVALGADRQVAGAVAGTHLRGAAVGARSLLACPETSADEGENAVSLPHRIGRFDLSQMLIIAGALLLVFGALMLGGGFLSVAASLHRRSLGLRAYRLAVRAQQSRARRTFGIHLRSDARGPAHHGVCDRRGQHVRTKTSKRSKASSSRTKAKEIKLALRLIPSEEQPGEIKTFEPGVPGAIPPQGQFALVFAFPENGGVTARCVLSAIGGVMLRVRYEVAGRKSPSSITFRRLSSSSSSRRLWARPRVFYPTSRSLPGERYVTSGCNCGGYLHDQIHVVVDWALFCRSAWSRRGPNRWDQQPGQARLCRATRDEFNRSARRGCLVVPGARAYGSAVTIFSLATQHASRRP